ncbi:M20/M25/M40 family metallo-hydrolase [Arcicella lustrica]|uniref:Carboxypeptidase Q n=1 Tax=Arcicella lustrica TaxID=2984196 RepID=A0ABU5SDT7_9BACT|nr:M20/M25/M40 family metallo-hydrolase [Arcicella sp. DC25W]MEA5425438.1 M20/M25/M40 family metallo-hydrolase [Arcicella sp. DC25W]
MKKQTTFITSLILSLSLSSFAQDNDSTVIRKFFNESLSNGKSYEWLRDLTTNVGPRLSGSEGAKKAVQWGKTLLESGGYDRVFLQDVMVPHWVRGAKEEGYILDGKQKIKVPLVALGGSVATPKKGITAEVIEVKTFQELRALGKEKCEGKIIFFNRPMDPTKINTFEAYGQAGDQRRSGANEAAKLGAIGVIIRSLSSTENDFPHTGSMVYATGVPLIPAAALSTNAATLLSKTLKENPNTKFYFKQSCETLPDAPSHNVVAEIKGSEHPEEIIVVGGHLDSWDLAQGAHDDGTGIVQSMEVARLFKNLGIKPKHTIRIVLFMNEENGNRGGVKYAELAKQNNEKHIFALESDNGGFTPRGFGMQGASAELLAKVQSYRTLLAPYGLHEIERGGGGVDIGPLAPQGSVLIGFKPDAQRYFEYHHASNDTFDTVNQRELEMGAASMASLIYLLDNLTN